MADFKYGAGLNAAIESIFEEANEQLTIISPFIKLHQRNKDSLKRHIDTPELRINLVFGKNQSNKSKSLSKEDFEFFKQFKNIKIYYEPRLHAKYYANESGAVLTSMNLYEYSQNNNIEFGISINVDKKKDRELDGEAYKYFENVKNSSSLKFNKEPQFEKTLFGLKKKYLRSTVMFDELTNELAQAKNTQKPKADSVKIVKPKIPVKPKGVGYCIRSGEPVPFDIQKPYTDKAFKSWNRFKNKDFSEKFCHYSGEPSGGNSSMAKPILNKNWKAAKKEFKL